MSRKTCRRRVIVPLPPRGLRPTLSADQVRDLALAHHVNLDDVATGRAGVDVLWQMAGGVLTWSRVADLLRVHQAEMAQQLEVVNRTVARYVATGRVGFSGADYQLAKRGVTVMDELALIVDTPTAVAAAHWSDARVNAMAAQADARSAARRQNPEMHP